MLTPRRLRHQQRQRQHGGQRPDPRAGRRLAGADLLDVRRRPAPDRRPDAGRLRDRRVAVPVRRARSSTLIVRPPEYLDDVRDARARDAGRRGAPALSSTTSCARTATTRSRRDYLRCPSCMRRLKERCYSCGKPIDPRLEALPVLRGRDGRRPAALRAPPAPRGARRSRPSPAEPRRSEPSRRGRRRSAAASRRAADAT